jgi:hypothetical protein
VNIAVRNKLSSSQGQERSNDQPAFRGNLRKLGQSLASQTTPFRAIARLKIIIDGAERAKFLKNRRMGILHNNFPCIDIFHLLLFVLIVMSDVV